MPTFWKNLFKIHVIVQNVFKKRSPWIPNFHFLHVAKACFTVPYMCLPVTSKDYLFWWKLFQYCWLPFKCPIKCNIFAKCFYTIICNRQYSYHAVQIVFPDSSISSHQTVKKGYQDIALKKWIKHVVKLHHDHGVCEPWVLVSCYCHCCWWYHSQSSFSLISGNNNKILFVWCFIFSIGEDNKKKFLDHWWESHIKNWHSSQAPFRVAFC